MLAVAGGEERLQPQVDAHGRQRARLGLRAPQVAGEDDVSLARFALQGDSLDGPFNLAVDLHPDRAGVLDVEATAVEANPFPWAGNSMLLKRSRDLKRG